MEEKIQKEQLGNDSAIHLSIWICPGKHDEKDLQSCAEKVVRVLNKSATKERRRELIGDNLSVSKGKPNGNILLFGAPSDVLDKVKDCPGREFPAILVLPSTQWDDTIRQACSHPLLEVERILRGDNLGLGGYLADVAETALLQEAILAVYRRFCRPFLAERELCKQIAWKARLAVEDKSGEEGGFFSLFCDPATRHLLAELKLAVRDLCEKLESKASDKLTYIARMKELQKMEISGLDYFCGMEQEEQERLLKPVPSVLLLGESGTGKTLIARWIAETLFKSSNLERIFYRVNISAISDELVDSSLFGIVDKFATDTRDHLGVFLSNRGKVVFLDEIGDMDHKHQIRLLTFLDEGSIQPVGWHLKPIGADVIVVAATNRPVREWITQGDPRFRKDLFNRFQYVIAVPPLRERVADRRLLISLLLQDPRINPEAKGVTKISLDAISYLEKREFPGNFRELQRVLGGGVNRALAERSDTICLRHIIGDRQS